MNGWRVSRRVFSSYLLLYIHYLFFVLVLCCFVLKMNETKCNGKLTAQLDILTQKEWRWRWPFVTGWFDGGAGAGERDGRNQLSVSVERWGWGYSPYWGMSKLRSMKLVHPAAFQLTLREKDSARDQTRTVWGVGSNWLNEGFPFHVLIENGQRPSVCFTSRCDVLSVWHS